MIVANKNPPAKAARDSTGQPISSLFTTPARYLRSVHLERDFHDPNVLRQYVLTDSMRRPFERIIEGVRSGSTRRAWRITGDFGTGKSSFALALAHLLRSPKPVREAKELFARLKLNPPGKPFLPVLVTGRREQLVPAIAEAAGRCAAELRISDRETNGHFRNARTGDVGALLKGLSSLAEKVGGVLLVLDELGKFLEHAAAHSEHDDVYALQQLAEQASRSAATPILLLGLLHQGFQAYADPLPTEARLEWEKVAGRFEELAFDQPLPHTMALAAAALGLRTSHLPPRTLEVLRRLVRRALDCGWTQPNSSDAYAAVYPLHPTVLPVLVRFFARFGQHERSLYNFLLSHDVGALQDFSLRPATACSWYTIADFYEYVRAAFGHSLGGGSYRSYWSRLVDTIDGIPDLKDDEARVLRAVALLNVVDAEHMRADPAMIAAALWKGEEDRVAAAIDALRTRGVLFARPSGDLRLWPATSPNLHDIREDAIKALGLPEPVSRQVPHLLAAPPILARRHAIETGTLRYFDVRYVTPEVLVESAASTSADGLLLAALCETEEDRTRAVAEAKKLRLQHALVCLSSPLGILQRDLHEVRVWQWVLDHTPELAQDSYARAEASRFHANALRTLSRRLTECLPVRLASAPKASWFYRGEQIALPPQGVTAFLSRICEDAYPEAPRISHDLLNRQALSSAGAAARSRLIERMFTHAEQPDLGLDPTKAPPERSMYLSVLLRGRVHREISPGRFGIALPIENDDPLHLFPALEYMRKMLVFDPDARCSVESMLRGLSAPPFGVRAGVAVVLLAILLTAHGHEIAIYEDGTFIPRMDAAAFLRLTKAPTTFHLQWAAISGVRAAVFARLAEVFATRATTDGLLDVVTPLCVFVAQQLPEHARRTHAISEIAIRVREALTTAHDPAAMLFRDLPHACGFAPFGTQDEPDAATISGYVTALQRAIEELRAAYPLLLRRIEGMLLEQLRIAQPIHREKLAKTASGVALRATHDLALKAFALRLADHRLPSDPWLEAVGSTVIAKPPRKWLDVDEERFRVDLAGLVERYRRLQQLDALVTSDTPVAFHIGLMSLDGASREQVVELLPGQQGALTASLEEFARVLPQDRMVRLLALSKLLWDELRAPGAEVK
ncbi:MAG: hypothetical protein HY791_15910 [Deltaproteobacteria bacterium]|nr:hypothetical protein [Deltaproteobacteria bacterium]